MMMVVGHFLFQLFLVDFRLIIMIIEDLMNHELHSCLDWVFRFKDDGINFIVDNFEEDLPNMFQS